MKKLFRAIWKFLAEVKGELFKVTWLTKKQAYEYTAVVIALSLVSAAFIGGCDYFFTFLINKFIL